MLYLISGSSRSGKTIIAENILKKKKIPYMSLDWLVIGFTNGIPEYGIHDKLFPNEIAEKMWKFLNGMIISMLWNDIDYLIEGEAILPELIIELVNKYPDKIRICFVGYTDIEVENKIKDVKKFSNAKNDWLTKESDEYIRDHINNMIKYSKRIKASCDEYNLRFFDTSKDFLKTIDTVIEFLLKS